jgi:uncharacterized protein YciI
MRTILFLVLVLNFCSLQAQEKKYTIIFLTRHPQSQEIPEQETQKVAADHCDKLKKLTSENKLLASGSYEGGGGILLLNTAVLSEARQWISETPAIDFNYWSIEILPCIPEIGGVCRSLATAEIITYSLVRFDAVVSKFNASTYPEIIQKHDEYVKQLNKTGNVIIAAMFGPSEGGILVMKGVVDEEVFEMDPGVQEGLMEITIKKLHIAKGSFCESD